VCVRARARVLIYSNSQGNSAGGKFFTNFKGSSNPGYLTASRYRDRDSDRERNRQTKGEREEGPTNCPDLF
jgi:hypothetical protein